MSLIRSVKIIQRIDFLVRSRSTGSARDLSRRFGVSRRTIFEYLSDLRELGAPISWSYEYNSYIYHEGFFIEINFSKSKADTFHLYHKYKDLDMFQEI
jgi:predicted DNA-binding transcriptional regulator YafY